MVRATLRDYYNAVNQIEYIRTSTGYSPINNPVNAEESPFHPFGLTGDPGSSWNWIDSNDAVALNERPVGGVSTTTAVFGLAGLIYDYVTDEDIIQNWPSGGIILAVKPGFRVKLRIESNANNAFNGIESWTDENPVQELGGGVISNNGDIGATDRSMTVALAKGDFLFAKVDGGGAMPEYVSTQTQVTDPFILGINRVRQSDSTTLDELTGNPVYRKGDYAGTLEIFSMPALGDDVRVYLEEVQYIPGEEGMFLLFDGNALQGIAGEYDSDTGTVQATRPHESGLVAQTFTIGEQLNYKVEVMGEPIYESETSINWIYVWWVLVNGTKKDGPYEDKRDAVIQAEIRWGNRPDDEDTITPENDYNYGALVLLGLFVSVVGFTVWYMWRDASK